MSKRKSIVEITPPRVVIRSQEQRHGGTLAKENWYDTGHICPVCRGEGLVKGVVR